MDIGEIRHRNFRHLITSLESRGITKRRDQGAQLGGFLSPSYVSQLLGGKHIGDDVAKKISASLSHDPGWMDRPQWEEDASSISPILETETAAGYVRFPLLEGFVGAGGEGYMPDHPEVVRYLDVAEDWAERNLRAPRDAVRVITARGDSMTGDIGDGDVLFVDSRVQDFDTDSIYVMNWQGRPLVKRLQLRRDGSVLIRSTNPAYEPEVVPPGEVDQLFISGRVLAAWGFKRF